MGARWRHGSRYSRARQLIGDRTKGGHTRLLARVARSVAGRAHMRLFVAMIVEADGDAGVRWVMRRGTDRMGAALADALGGARARERARLILAAL